MASIIPFARSLIITGILLLPTVATSPFISARKTTLRLKGDNKELIDTVVRGSFQVASYCESCNNGYRLDQIQFSGFDKPGSSSSESFFITNNTDRTLSGISLYIEYLTPEGRQLHKRWVRLNCSVPPGETRKADIKSWDTQKAFHYSESNPGRHSSPFTVRFDPVAIYLRF